MQFDLFGALRLDTLSLDTVDRLAFMQDGHPQPVVLARDGGLLSPPPPHHILRPLQLICADLTGNQGRNMRYVVRSALHKEVRRGDVAAAVRWSRILQLIDGPAAIRQIARHILFEETRNTELAMAWRGQRNLNPEQMIRAIAASPKKWQLSAHRGASYGQRRLLAYPTALRSSPITPPEIEQTVNRSTLTLDEAFVLQWRVMLSGERPVQTHLHECIVRRAQRETDSVLQGLAAGNESHGDEVMLERLCGVSSPEACETGPDRDVAVDDRVLTLPPLRAYVHDPHTRPGMRRLTKHLSSIRPQHPPPPQVDLRWSGMARGAAWRAALGDKPETAWEAIDIPDALWHAAVQADAFFYARLCREAHVPGLTFPRTVWNSAE